MDHVVCSEQRVRSHGPLLAVRFQSSCSLWELVYECVLKLEKNIKVEMEIRKSDLRSCKVILTACKILEIARQQLGVVVKSFQVWRGCFLPRNLPKVGMKRGLRNQGMFQHYVNGCCVISVYCGASKKSRIVGPCPDSLRFEASTLLCYDDRQYISSDMIEEFSSLDSLDCTHLGDAGCKRVASGILSIRVCDIWRVHNIRRFRNIRIVRSCLSTRNREIVEVPERVKTPTKWESLPNELHENILHRLEFKDLFRFKTLSQPFKEYIESEAFQECRGKARSSQSEGLFTAISYHIKDKQWRWSGFDLSTRMWKRLPSLSLVLPAPDPELFKEYSLCGHGGLICADIAKLPKKGELVVLNPLTQKKRELPPLLYPRSPVLIHLWVDSASASKFKVIVAGSSVSSDEKLSRKIEVFDSETSVWEAAPDLPGPAFGINEHQVGVCVDGVLHFISFLDSCDGTCRGVVAFDLHTRTWLRNRTCPIPFATYSNTLQLVESRGKVCLFSEQERAGLVTHCIDELELVDEKWKLRNVVRVKKSGGRGLQVYPEHTCVSFGDEKLCIFNTLTRSGVVYGMNDGKEVEALEPPPFDQKGDNFFSLNPASFVLQPSFGSDPGNSS